MTASCQGRKCSASGRQVSTTELEKGYDIAGVDMLFFHLVVLAPQIDVQLKIDFVLNARKDAIEGSKLERDMTNLTSSMDVVTR